MTVDLLEAARADGGDAFRQLIEPYERELRVHCYCMLGSAADAEDAMQEALLAAWQALGGFEGRASVRTWLYRIVTTRCPERETIGEPSAADDPPGGRPPTTPPGGPGRRSPPALLAGVSQPGACLSAAVAIVTRPT